MQTQTELDKKLNKLAVRIREGVVLQLHTFGFGHLGGSMSAAELLACLYGAIMKYDAQNPAWPERDRLVMSKGHCGPVLYSALALAGFFPYEELKTLNQPHTRLPSHVDHARTPGVDMTTGSLGQGISAACGMAYALKLKGSASRVYVILGDGECQEGQVWEAALFAAHCKLNNLIAFVDANAEQFDRYIEDNVSLGDLAAKFTSFGWNVLDVPDGHDVHAIMQAHSTVLPEKTKPSVIILHTKKGYGYPATDRLPAIHHIPVNDADAKEAYDYYKSQLRELNDD